MVCHRLICAGQCDFLPTPQGHLSQRGAAQNETTTLGEGLKYRRPDHTSHDSRHTQTPCRAMPVWPCPPLPELPRVEVHEVEARQQRVHGLLRERLRRPDRHHAALETQHAPDAAQGRNQALEDDLWQGGQAWSERVRCWRAGGAASERASMGGVENDSCVDFR